MQTIPPPYVVRTILVYSRPPCQPQFSLTEPMKVSGVREGGLCAASRVVVRRQEGPPDQKSCGAYRQVPRAQDRSRGVVTGEWSQGRGVSRALKAGILPLQKMFQCPYFFFDVVYIHNGADDKEEEMSWKVRGSWARRGAAGRCGWGVSGPSRPGPRESRLRFAALEPWPCRGVVVYSFSNRFCVAAVS